VSSRNSESDLLVAEAALREIAALRPSTSDVLDDGEHRAFALAANMADAALETLWRSVGGSLVEHLKPIADMLRSSSDVEIIRTLAETEKANLRVEIELRDDALRQRAHDLEHARAEIAWQNAMWEMQSQIIGLLAAEVPFEVRERILAPLRQAKGRRSLAESFMKACAQIVALKKQNMEVLADFYRAAPQACAALCNNKLDKTGALLGHVREAAER
jgi:hypothetical protein